MILRAKSVGIFVEDQAVALEFYTRKLGFEVRSDRPMGPDARWLEVAPPGAETTLALYTPPGEEARIGDSGSIIFECEDVRSTYEKLRGRGVHFTQEPATMPGGTFAEFVDPDGNEFVLAG